MREKDELLKVGQTSMGWSGSHHCCSPDLTFKQKMRKNELLMPSPLAPGADEWMSKAPSH